MSVPSVDVRCGWAVSNGRVTSIPMERNLIPWRWILTIEYFAGTATPAEVTVGGNVVPIRFEAGLHRVWIVHNGPVGDVVIGGLDPGRTVCVTNVSIGEIDSSAL